MATFEARPECIKLGNERLGTVHSEIKGFSQADAVYVNSMLEKARGYYYEDEGEYDLDDPELDGNHYIGAVTVTETPDGKWKCLYDVRLGVYESIIDPRKKED